MNIVQEIDKDFLAVMSILSGLIIIIGFLIGLILMRLARSKGVNDKVLRDSYKNKRVV